MAASDIGKSVRRRELFILLVGASLLFSSSGNAQYSANFQTNLISVTSSNWVGDYVIGDFNYGDCLLIQNVGRLIDNNCYVGYEASGSNNSVVVADSGSVRSNRFTVYLGYAGPHNSLVISNGAKVLSASCVVGSAVSSSNNSILVTDNGTVWNNNGAIALGYVSNGGGHNSLVISNGAQVACEPNGSYNWVGLGANNSNSVVVTGAGSVWKGVYNAYLSSVGDSIVVRDGGAVFGNTCFLSGNKCRILVADSSSIWSNREGFFFNGSDSGNSLVISNGASVFDSFATVYGSNTSVVVTGTDSVWNNRSTLAFATSSRGNSLLISNSALVANGTGSVGGSNNAVRVVDGGVWQNTGLTVGDPGPNDSLVVAGGSVFASSLLVGKGPTACDNFVQLDSGSLVVTNGTHDAVLEVRYGKLILNGGVLRADTLVMTNSCGQFVHTGGTLIVGSILLDPNLDADGDGMPNGWEQAYGLDPLQPKDAFSDEDGDGCNNLCEYLAGSNPVADIKSIKKEGNDIRITWKTAGNQGISKTNALQRAPGGIYDPNAFADIFVITNYNGAVTNYLDVGAATNKPALYYRVRLVP